MSLIYRAGSLLWTVVSLFLFVPSPGLIFLLAIMNHLRGHRQNNLPRYDALLG